MENEILKKLLIGGKPEEIDGWICLKIVGAPYARGFQHGYYLADQIKDAIRVNSFLAEWDTGKKWNFFIENANRLFAHHLDEELMSEIEGITDGACNNGFQTTFEEILTWNSYQDLLGSWWPSCGSCQIDQKKNLHRCSAFIAHCDSGIIMSQNCWDRFPAADHYNIILDIQPSNGNRMLFQCPPGYIASTIDWWITGADLMITETTISRFNKFDETKTPEFIRSRKASQYAANLGAWKEIMCSDCNGGYSGSWLLGDNKTGEIAKLETGLNYFGFETKTEGYFSGYNVAENLQIRNLECSGNVYSDVRDSGARRVRFMQLLKQCSNLDIETAKNIISDHYDVYLNLPDNPCSRTICGHLDLDDAAYGSHSSAEPFFPWGAVDGKVVDSAMAKDMSFLAIWGRACGKDFNKDEFLRMHPQYLWLDPYMKSRPPRNWQTIKGNKNSLVQNEHEFHLKTELTL